MTAPTPVRFAASRTGEATAGNLAANVLLFARVLRASGVPIGVGKALAAIEAAARVGPERRDDFRAALAATLIERNDQRALFERAFESFFRPASGPSAADLPRVTSALAPASALAAGASSTAAASALAGEPAVATEAAEQAAVAALRAAGSASPAEVLHARDFAAMSPAELAAARRLLRKLDLPLPSVRTRRRRPDPRGCALDLRATLRRSLRYGGEWIVQARRSPGERPADLVVLCDVSGSMSQYARMLLHFVHGLVASRRGLHAFAFGTRLTNLTPALKSREVERALAAASRRVPDWSGGTRIGDCLREFNRRWSRRLLGRGAVVLIITDGLEAGDCDELAREMQRLRASCRSILWLNPLLRFAGFEPRAAGIRTMLPWVDRMLPAHNLASLAELGRALSAGLRTPGGDRWHSAAHSSLEPRRPGPARAEASGNTMETARWR